MTVNAQVFQEEQVQPFFYITVAVPSETTGCSKAFAKEGKTVEILSHQFYIKKAVHELYLCYVCSKDY